MFFSRRVCTWLKLLTFLTAALLVLSKHQQCEENDAVCSARKSMGAEANEQASIDTGWTRTEYTLSYFPVAGVNLALYGMTQQQDGDGVHSPNDESSSDPFQLFEDFHIGEVAMAEEGDAEKWHQFYRYYKRSNDAPSLSFYNDKVAFKRWLLSKGDIDIPRIMLLCYVSDFLPKDHVDQNGTTDPSITVHQLANTILHLLPTNETDFVAKPTHKSRSMGVWVVSRDVERGITRVGHDADQSRGLCTDLKEKPDFELSQVAMSLAENILAEYIEGIGIAQRRPRPGIVVEERFTTFDSDDYPALEFKCLVVWGRLFVAVWRRGARLLGYVNRDGTMLKGSAVDKLTANWAEAIPDWVDWSRVVDIAEQLGAHKDFVRVDIFVGIPGGTSSLLSETERLEEVRHVASEMSSTSSEVMPAPVLDEFTRLWVAGYKLGNFQVVPNTEVPSDFLTRVQEKEQR